MVGTRLQVSDNSGARSVQCIKLLNNLQFASIGDTIIVSIKDTIAKQKSKVEKGGVYKALIVETVAGGKPMPAMKCLIMKVFS